MPSADGAIGLGLGTWTLLKAPGLRSPRFDTKHVKRSCGATLPSRHTRTSPAKGAKVTDVLTAAPTHAEHAQVGRLVALGRLVAREVAD